MCITSSESILDSTYIGAWDIEHPKLGYRHVLAYQNRVQNLSIGPNCMLLHIQSKEDLSPSSIIDTSNEPTFLSHIYGELNPPSLSRSGDWMGPSNEKLNYVVENGVYHIAILNNLSQSAIKNTLGLIPKSKLPEIDDELVSFFKENFSGFPLLLCCFDNKDAKQAAPILVHYIPKYPKTLLLNTIDSHGGVPKLNKNIRYHQKIIVGSYKCCPGIETKYYKYYSSHPYEDLKDFLPKYAMAADLMGLSGLNKDLCIPLAEIYEDKIPSPFLDIMGTLDNKTEITTNYYSQNYTFSLEEMVNENKK